MGIPRLTTQISPYGVPITYKKQAQGSLEVVAESAGDVIIDGPSFAYYIHKLCLTTKSNARNALEALPTYPELGETAVEWLRQLETFGLRIKHIYFDGFLPQSKLSTRHDRLEKSLIQLRAFRSNNSNIAWGRSTATMRRKLDASEMKHVPSRLTAIPAAPFLVPVVLDALRNSCFSSVTTTVACEAEVACVNDREPKDMILTSDSDLLVLTPVGRVMFFNDFSFGSLMTPNDTLEGVYYSRLDLASKLNCGNLLKMAFYMTRDPHLGIKECAKQASQLGFPSENVAHKYAQFKENYATAAQYSAFACVTEVKNPYPALQESLERLDPRISEIVQQWLSGLDTTKFPIIGSTSDYISSQQSRTMFLAFLIDDPTRASAWRASSEIRCMAYSILALYGPAWKMIEYDRRGERMVGVEISLIKQPQSLVERCKMLLVDLSAIELHGDTGLQDEYKLFLLTSVLKSAAASTTAMPDRESISHFLTSPSTSYSWPHIHLSAQLEGCLYSYRVLQQMLSVYLCGDIPAHPEVDIQMLQDLHKVLKSSPSPRDILQKAGGGLRLELESSTIKLNSILDELYGTSGTSNPADQFEPATEGFEVQKSKRRKRGTRTGLPAKSNQKAGDGPAGQSNMFTLLDG